MLEKFKQFNANEIEQEVLKFWNDHQIFKKSLEHRVKHKPFRFYEGPPTANGRPGVHHAEARAFKDIVLRYKTMRGYYVPRRAGWDTHGLPVEIEVEKKLGLKNKRDIEKFGIAEFNAKAKESVWEYKNEWEKFTERLGFWIDSQNPYITYENKYIESLWWVLGQAHKKDLLKKLYKVVPWCPRCQTPLSSHELAQPGAYKKTIDPSLYVKFKLKEAKGKHEYLLVWTTTPWTLPANVAVAVNSKLTYTKYKIGDEYIWSYSVPPKASVEDIEVMEKISGHKLVGRAYEPLYANNGEHKIIAAGFVSTEEGTGFVHIAPAFGEDDLQAIGKHADIPVTIDDRGHVTANVPGKGKFIKQADKDIVADLGKRGLVYQAGETEHDYPYCWRCSSPLIYFARYSWFIEMSKLRNELMAANKKINWVPEHLQEGRFGEWLKEVKDWSISRNRYWGMPLPIWECGSCKEHTVVNSLEELDKYAGHKNKFFFVRHGRADHNVRNTLSENPERTWISKLTPEGIVQIEGLAKKLKKEKISLIYTSPFYRAKQSAEIIAKVTGAKVIVDERLHELNSGVLNGKPEIGYNEFYGRNEKPVLAEFTKTPPGGENLNDARKRALLFLNDINRNHKNETIVVVGHGHPLWAMMGVAAGATNEEVVAGLLYPRVGEYYEAPFRNLPRDRNGILDMHRPFIDEIMLQCRECKGTMARVKEVADVWFESGAMPYAQWHYPFENKQLVDKKQQFPADYITEAIDQTRGWFYTLLAVSVFMGRGVPYKNVICLGHVLDKSGQKMSKSKGNTVDPNLMMQKYGADTLRWYFYTVNPPGEPKKFDELDLGKISRSLFMILYNCFNFLKTGQVGQAPNKVLDAWMVSRLNETIEAATKNLEAYDIGAAGKAVQSLIDDLTHWYIRRSRKNMSSETLRAVLAAIARLLAPFAPFFSEAMYKSLVTSDKTQVTSVHLADWPKTDKKKIDKKLMAAMAEIRRIASVALAEREKAGIKVRQPLATLKAKSSKLKASDKELLQLLKDEVNVKEVIINQKLKTGVELDTMITPELRNEGIMRELTRMVQDLRKEAGYRPTDEVFLAVQGSADLERIIVSNEAQFKKDVKVKAIEYRRADKFNAEVNAKLEDWTIWLSVRK